MYIKLEIGELQKLKGSFLSLSPHLVEKKNVSPFRFFTDVHYWDIMLAELQISCLIMQYQGAMKPKREQVLEAKSHVLQWGRESTEYNQVTSLQKFFPIFTCIGQSYFCSVSNYVIWNFSVYLFKIMFLIFNLPTSCLDAYHFWSLIRGILVKYSGIGQYGE